MALCLALVGPEERQTQAGGRLAFCAWCIVGVITERLNPRSPSHLTRPMLCPEFEVLVGRAIDVRELVLVLSPVGAPNLERGLMGWAATSVPCRPETLVACLPRCHMSTARGSQ